MTAKEYILGVDYGTTAVKTAIFDLQGNTIASVIKEYQLITPAPLEVEINIETIWKAFRDGVKESLSKSNLQPEAIKALGISAQGETLIPIGKDGKALRNAIVWLDNRAEKEATVLDNRFNEESYRITGQVKIVPTWPAAKILWLKKHEPELFKKVYKYLLIEDYFISKLSGVYVSEGSLLCSTCYWNITTKKWWTEMLNAIGINSDQLPEIKEPGEKVSNILPPVAKELGLSPDTIVSTGALDQACGTIAVGNIKPGVFTENIGGALAICATLEKAVFDKKRKLPIHYHALPNTYMVHTFTTGGMALRWFRDNFCQEEMRIADQTKTSAYDIISSEVNQIPAGCEGLIMLPHLQGAMAPEANPKAKGVYFGFTLRHQKPHFARAIMEAIGCIVKRNIEALEDMKINVNEIRAYGGGSRSTVWNQIVADLTKRPVITTKHDEDAACLGAAMLAGVATGMFENIEDATKRMIQIKGRTEPNRNNFKTYDVVYAKYVKLYDSLVTLYEAS